MHTIFFEGFTTTFSTEEINDNLDPQYWVLRQGTGQVTGRLRLNPNGNVNDSVYNMYRMNGHTNSDTTNTDDDRVYTDQAVLCLDTFPTGFMPASSGWGMGFYINKLASEVAGVDENNSLFAQRLLKIYNSSFSDPDASPSAFATASGALELDIVHSTGTEGYGNANNSRNLSLRVRTPNNTLDGWVENYFDLNVLGSVWNYLQPSQDAAFTTDKQRAISTFVEDISGDYIGTYQEDDYYNGLYIEISAVSTGLLTSDPYELQVRLNGMNLHRHNSNHLDQTIGNLKSVFDYGTAGKFFDKVEWYGARATGVAGEYNDNQHTYLDDIYIICNTGNEATHQNNFLGANTKVFALFPNATGVNTDASWRQFSADSGFADINASVMGYLKSDDGDNSYVYTEHNEKPLTLEFDNISIDTALNINNYIIGGIKITNSSRKVSNDVYFQNVWSSGLVGENNAPTGIGEIFAVTGTNYKYQNQYLMNNPITNQKWEREQINDGRFGIVKLADNSTPYDPA